jgi:indole-3-glycerol phosphate synthase
MADQINLDCHPQNLVANKEWGSLWASGYNCRVATYLDRILVAHRAAAEQDGRSSGDLKQQALAQPPTRGFRAALAADTGLSVIAEVKRRSPSKGELHPGLVPASVASSYEIGGATALSVLTDHEFFGGSPEDLAEARSATSLPALRKDFTVALNDIFDARIMGADAILLIAAALNDVELHQFIDAARDVDLDVLVEIHDEAELERALTVEADLIGVNQRDLVTFEVDQARAVRMAPQLPEGVIRVAESGVRDSDDAATLAGAGYHAVLVGESLVTAGDPADIVARLRSAGK